ncbi:MAG TPA: FG-GAP-like repeat-containing protein [Mycobacteriales bacterium]|nr:FG-GAP-like repeat-containing protein [Mycobacteriales bacterium]
MTDPSLTLSHPLRRFGRRSPLVVAIIAAVAVLMAQAQGEAITKTAASAKTPTYSQALVLNKDANGSSTTVASKDLNGDGRPDIVSGDSAGKVEVELNLGNGRFGNSRTYSVDGNVTTLVVADVNGDGHPDIVTADDSSGNVAVLLNKGNGTFDAPVFYSTGGKPWGLAVGDVTGDGRPDIVTSDQTTEQISVLAGKGNGTFGTAKTYSNGLTSDYPAPQGLALGDFQGNGRLDVVVADGGTGSAGGTYVTYLANNGHGAFPTADTMEVGDTYQDPAAIVTGDFNGDGHLDYAVDLEGGCFGVGDGDVLIYLGNGHGTFTGGKGIGTDCNYGTVVTDVNGDGIPDLVTAVGNFFAGGSYVEVNIGKGDGTFYPGVITPVDSLASPNGIALAALTGHGGHDVVIPAQNGDISAVFDEHSGGPDLLLGTVRQSNTAVAGAPVQVCHATSGAQPSACRDAGQSSQAGDFAETVSRGDTYGVTAFPPSDSDGLAPRTVGPIKIDQHVTVTAADFTATLPPSGSMLTTAAGNVEQNEVPTINWGEPSTYSTTGCSGGFGDLLVGATNTATGQPETEAFPMPEDPSGSGTYVSHIPALAPLHGDGGVQQFVTCPEATHLAPDGGSPTGGTYVLVTGSGFSGATAVHFGSTRATSYTVLGDDLIDAVAPAGTGSVTVTVTKSGGGTETVGSYGYVGVSSLDMTSGPAAGGTSVTIHGSGFTHVGGVIFGVVPAASFSVVNSTEIQATSPEGVGTVQVQVVNNESVTAPSNNSAFRFSEVRPGRRASSKEPVPTASGSTSRPSTRSAHRAPRRPRMSHPLLAATCDPPTTGTTAVAGWTARSRCKPSRRRVLHLGRCAATSTKP